MSHPARSILLTAFLTAYPSNTGAT